MSEQSIITQINRNFVIRWKNQHEPQTNLIGAGQYVSLVGEELKRKHFDIVQGRTLQNYTFKIRNRLEIVFVSR